MHENIYPKLHEQPQTASTLVYSKDCLLHIIQEKFKT